MRGLLPLRPPFLARLDTARELGWRFFRGARWLGGPGAPPEEFEGHRLYTPGDDVRWIDWNLFARREEFHVKVFRADEEVEVLIMIDASASMTGAGVKHETAAAAGAALARLALITGHPVRAARYADRLLDVSGSWRSPDDFTRLQRHLGEQPPPGEGTDLLQALEPLLAGHPRPTSVVAITDCFQRAPLVSAVAGALARGVRRIALVRVLDPDDLAPRLRGHTVLLDPEGAGRHALMADRAFEKEARLRIADHFVRLRDECARLGTPLHALPVREPFEEALIALLRAGSPTPAPAAA